MLRLGDLEFHLVTDGDFRLDGGAMFGIIPRPLWEKALPPDSKNRIPMKLRCLLVRGRGRTLLVDTGMGDKWSEKDRGIYALERGDGLVGALASLGVRPEDVTDVLLTHLHFDHTGGSTRRDEGGRLVPAFPRATWHVQRLNWDWANSPTPKDRGSYLPENFAPLHDAGVLRLLEGPGEILPGVEVAVLNGHTPGMQVPRFRTDDGEVSYLADLVPTSAHLRLPWVMGYDCFPITTIREKAELLAPVARGGSSIVVFEHDPVTGAARIRPDGEHFAVAEPLAF